MRPATLRFYQQQLTWFLAYATDAGITNPDEISAFAIRSYLSSMQRHALAPASVQSAARAIRSCPHLLEGWSCPPQRPATENARTRKKLIDTAQAAPNTVILAQDEASLYLQATLQVVWHARGQTPVVKVDPGRDMVHFYGALNLHNGQEIAMMSPVMNAETTALYLQKLLLAYPDQPLLLLWDRAPWHKGTPIRELLQANPRLELLAFPPGAPDLNPQEHVWKATRAAISHNHRIPRLQPLADLFLRHLTHTTFHSSLLELHGFHIICPMFT